MKLSVARVAQIASVSLAVVAGTALAANRSASAQEIVEGFTPAMTTSQFANLFGKPASVVGTAWHSTASLCAAEHRGRPPRSLPASSRIAAAKAQPRGSHPASTSG
jgi:negative regulator of sigma E activity